MSQNKSIRRLLCDGKVVGYLIHAYGLLFVSKSLEPYSSLGLLQENWVLYGHGKYGMYINHDCWDEGRFFPNGEVVFAGGKIKRTWNETVEDYTGSDALCGDEDKWVKRIITRTATGTLRYDVEKRKGFYIDWDEMEHDCDPGIFNAEWKWSELSLVEE
ncbi:MAG TPA: hypothetical protein ENH82_11415 [bacterium]|nr:hypothetical protein [bacterium]